MYSQKDHLSRAGSTHRHHDGDFALEDTQHEANLGVINEEHDTQLTHQHHANFTPLSFESSEGSESSSTSLSDILEGLPTAVKSSLGPLMTIRRSVSIRGWVSYFYEISTNSTSAMDTTMSHEERAEHHTLVSTSTTTAVGMQQQAHQSNQGQKRRRASTTRSTKTSTELVEYVEPRERLGIDRFCGLQGQLLVNNALADSRSSTALGYSGGDRNERRAYVQGVTWLMQGLPEDLDARERTDLLRAMPNSLLDDMSLNSGVRRLGSSSRAFSGTKDRSIVHRTVAAIVVQLMVPLQVLWAYFVMLLGRALQLERKYKVMEQVVKHSGELGYMMGKRGVKLTGTIYNNGGARAAAMIMDTVTYVADGLVKGINDGIREACLEFRETGEQ